MTPGRVLTFSSHARVTRMRSRPGYLLMNLQLAHHAACTTSRANSAAPSVSSSFIGLCTCSADASGTSEGPCIHVRNPCRPAQRTTAVRRRRAAATPLRGPHGTQRSQRAVHARPGVLAERGPDVPFDRQTVIMTGRPCRTTYPPYYMGFQARLLCVTDMWDL